MNLWHEIVSSWFQWMSGMAFQVSLLVAVIVLVDRILVRWAWPQFFYVLWMLVVIRLIVPPSLTLPIGLLPAGVLPASALPTSLLATNVEPPAQIGVAESSFAMQIAFVVWASGVVFCAAMAIRRFHMIRRNLLQDTRPVNADIEKWFIDLSHELALQIGLGSAPQVRVKYGYASPVLVGILKPIVIVPAELLAITKRTQLRHALLHEFAHIKRHDLIWNSLCVFVQIIYWYHPLADRFSFGAAGLFSSRSQLIARLDWLHRPVGTTKCVVAV